MSKDKTLKTTVSLEQLEKMGFKCDMNDYELKNALYNLWSWGFSSGKLFEQGKFKKLDGRQFEMVDKVYGQLMSSFLHRQKRNTDKPTN